MALKKKIRKVQNKGSDVTHLRGPTPGVVGKGRTNERTEGETQESGWLVVVEIMFPLHKPFDPSSSALLSSEETRAHQAVKAKKPLCYNFNTKPYRTSS